MLEQIRTPEELEAIPRQGPFTEAQILEIKEQFLKGKLQGLPFSKDEHFRSFPEIEAELSKLDLTEEQVQALISEMKRIELEHQQRVQ